MSSQPRRTDRPRRILVAGAAGFIGSHLCERLLANGHRVFGVDNLITGDRQNLVHLENNPRFALIEHDIVEPLHMNVQLDWVMHLASPASPPKYLAQPIETLRANSEGTYQLLEVARRKGAQFFFTSTSEVYGDPDVHPQHEDYWGHVNPNGPRSVYDEAKRYGEAITAAYNRKHGVPVRIVRIFNTYGPRMQPDDGRVVVNFITQVLRGEPITIYGRGSQTRSFQYIDDLVDGILGLMRARHFEPVNIGNPEEHTVLELARIVQRVLRRESPLVFCDLPVDDPRQRRPDISLATRLLGWAPRVPIEEGLRRTAEYFRERLALGRRPAVATPARAARAHIAAAVPRLT
ncbi:MAG: SDR family oxidoreductase [Acidobacteria bacterium]|nr:SDR family oxidoreductase [Acidobacteriota bacterium]